MHITPDIIAKKIIGTYREDIRLALENGETLENLAQILTENLAEDLGRDEIYEILLVELAKLQPK